MYLLMYKLGRLFENISSVGASSFYQKYYTTFNLITTKCFGTIATEENCLPTLNLTLTLTQAEPGDSFPRGQCPDTITKTTEKKRNL